MATPFANSPISGGAQLAWLASPLAVTGVSSSMKSFSRRQDITGAGTSSSSGLLRTVLVRLEPKYYAACAKPIENHYSSWTNGRVLLVMT